MSLARLVPSLRPGVSGRRFVRFFRVHALQRTPEHTQIHEKMNMRTFGSAQNCWELSVSLDFSPET